MHTGESLKGASWIDSTQCGNTRGPCLLLLLLVLCQSRLVFSMIKLSSRFCILLLLLISSAMEFLQLPAESCCFSHRLWTHWWSCLGDLVLAGVIEVEPNTKNNRDLDIRCRLCGLY